MNFQMHLIHESLGTWVKTTQITVQVSTERTLSVETFAQRKNGAIAISPTKSRTRHIMTLMAELHAGDANESTKSINGTSLAGKHFLFRVL